MQRIIHKQDGFASIVVALAFTLVLGLIITGFAQLSRREQQSAIDNQLANQAYYAAESGINTANYDIFVKHSITPASTSGHPNPDTCYNTLLGAGSDTTPVPINNNTGSLITCFMVDLHPESLQWGAGALTPESLIATTQAPLQQMTIKWNSNDGNNNWPLSTKNKLPTADYWAGQHQPPVVEFSVTPLGTGSSINQNMLKQDTMTAYLYPSNNATCSNSNPLPCDYNAVIAGGYTQAPVIGGGCNKAALDATTYACSVTLTLPTDKIPDGNGGFVTLTNTTNDAYLVHFLSYYDGVSVNVSGTTNTAGAAKFIGQPVVDVTGKSRNTLKRVRVRLQNTNTPSGAAAIEAQGICKRLQTAPVIPNVNPDGTDYISAQNSPNVVNNIPGDDCDLN